MRLGIHVTVGHGQLCNSNLVTVATKQTTKNLCSFLLYARYLCGFKTKKKWAIVTGRFRATLLLRTNCMYS